MKSLIFRTTAHIVIGLMLVFSLSLLLRGHNEPGGGFIGALIAVIALALLILAESGDYVRKRLMIDPLDLAAAGICMALFSGLISFFAGRPFLTGLWWKTLLPIGTPILFDVGVYFAVIGAVLAVLLRLGEEVD